MLPKIYSNSDIYSMLKTSGWVDYDVEDPTEMLREAGLGSSALNPYRDYMERKWLPYNKSFADTAGSFFTGIGHMLGGGPSQNTWLNQNEPSFLTSQNERVNELYDKFKNAVQQMWRLAYNSGTTAIYSNTSGGKAWRDQWAANAILRNHLLNEIAKQPGITSKEFEALTNFQNSAITDIKQNNMLPATFLNQAVTYTAKDAAGNPVTKRISPIGVSTDLETARNKLIRSDISNKALKSQRRAAEIAKMVQEGKSEAQIRDQEQEWKLQDMTSALNTAYNTGDSAKIREAINNAYANARSSISDPNRRKDFLRNLAASSVKYGDGNYSLANKIFKDQYGEVMQSNRRKRPRTWRDYFILPEGVYSEQQKEKDFEEYKRYNPHGSFNDYESLANEVFKSPKKPVTPAIDSASPKLPTSKPLY